MPPTSLMTTEEIWRAVAVERASLAELLRDLPDSAWEHASLCVDWAVRDVVAHLILSARPTVGAILLGLLRARGDLHRMIRDTAIRHAARRTNEQLLAEFSAGIDLRVAALGTTPADRLMDVLVHGQDIAVPLGVAHPLPDAAGRAALDRVWELDDQFGARTGFAGYRLVTDDDAWQVGAGATIRGTAEALLLLISGRAVEPGRLTGDGAESWRARS
ncbi:maleylpyruvate isomerase family mycothiol-dependent enzyme [Nocardia takedensis]